MTRLISNYRAFGVLLWEIMSFGYIPYTGCTNREAMAMVTLGGRLEKPAGCPDPIYGIMTRCWHSRPEDRPSFATIVERIGYCLQVNIYSNLFIEDELRFDSLSSLNLLINFVSFRKTSLHVFRHDSLIAYDVISNW